MERSDEEAASSGLFNKETFKIISRPHSQSSDSNLRSQLLTELAWPTLSRQFHSLGSHSTDSEQFILVRVCKCDANQTEVCIRRANSVTCDKDGRIFRKLIEEKVTIRLGITLIQQPVRQKSIH